MQQVPGSVLELGEAVLQQPALVRQVQVMPWQRLKQVPQRKYRCVP
jgi:hypothetical protein